MYPTSRQQTYMTYHNHTTYITKCQIPLTPMFSMGYGHSPICIISFSHMLHNAYLLVCIISLHACTHKKKARVLPRTLGSKWYGPNHFHGPNHTTFHSILSYSSLNHSVTSNTSRAFSPITSISHEPCFIPTKSAPNPSASNSLHPR